MTYRKWKMVAKAIEMATDDRYGYSQELRDDIYRATAGVVRYPQGFVYNAGSNPFCGCGQMNGCCGNM